MPAHNGLTYRDSGVDIDAGEALVERIKPMAASTSRAGVMAGLGGFGAIFDPKATGYKDPLIVSATDGVGTKLLVANAIEKHDTVGIDLVAMCVNDLVVQAVEPMLFLDYFATGKLTVDAAAEVIAGIATGCREAGCALVGGETAELPGLYAPGDYDLAGFAVGLVERDGLLTGNAIEQGDILLGLESSGVHSNGFSLVRKIVEVSALGYDAPAPFRGGTSLGETLLTPTRIYVRPCLAVMRHGLVKGAAHITGGGLIENIPRILPAGLAAGIRADALPRLAVFDWLQAAGGISDTELLRTFNCGIGMVLIVGPNDVDDAIRLLRDSGEAVHRIGAVRRSSEADPSVVIEA